MNIDRRELLTRASLLIASASLPSARLLARESGTVLLPSFFEEIERRTFRWFWTTVNRRNGLVPDRWPSPSFCSIASVGFALPAYAIGVERGWCTRRSEE